MSAMPVKRTSRPVARPIDAATSRGVAASIRLLATRSAGPVAGTWSAPPTVTDHRSGASARASPTSSGSIPQGSTSLPPVAWRRSMHRPSGRFLRELVIGRHQYGDADNELMVDVVLRGVERPPPLRALFVGDFDRDVDISRAPLGDLSGIGVHPDLEDLQLRGRGDFFLDALDLPRLRRFALRTSSLPAGRLATILTARWPALEELELWTGNRSYGATCTAREFEGWLGSDADVPRLRVLRVMNSELTDELCAMLVASPRSSALEVLDLSLGTLTDHGAGVIAAGARAFTSLRELDVTWNALGRAGISALTRAGLPVRGTQRQKSSRYVSIGE